MQAGKYGGRRPRVPSLIAAKTFREGNAAHRVCVLAHTLHATNRLSKSYVQLWGLSFKELPGGAMESTKRSQGTKVHASRESNTLPRSAGCRIFRQNFLRLGTLRGSPTRTPRCPRPPITARSNPRALTATTHGDGRRLRAAGYQAKCGVWFEV